MPRKKIAEGAWVLVGSDRKADFVAERKSDFQPALSTEIKNDLPDEIEVANIELHIARSPAGGAIVVIDGDIEAASKLLGLQQSIQLEKDLDVYRSESSNRPLQFSNDSVLIGSLLEEDRKSVV
jgi:hypothetical protein